jgi:hypothetical protein
MALATVVAGLVLLVGGAEYYLNHEGAHLHALRADPMATFVPVGARQMDRRDSDEDRVTLEGPPSDARIRRDIGLCHQACFLAFVAEAQRTGWHLVTESSNSVRLERPVPNAQLVLVLNDHGSLDPTVATVHLGYQTDGARR